jgi:hypothetical protein
MLPIDYTRGAMGFEHDSEEIKVISMGKEGSAIERVAIRKIYPPDPTAAIFWLKNRQSAKWRDKHENKVDQSSTNYNNVRWGNQQSHPASQFTWRNPIRTRSIFYVIKSVSNIVKTGRRFGKTEIVKLLASYALQVNSLESGSRPTKIYPMSGGNWF